MKTYIIAAALVIYNNKYLIAKRSPNKKFSPDKWEFISGFIEEKESAEETILRELEEETSLKGKIIKSAAPYITEDNESRWIILPYLIETNSANFKRNEIDHSEIKWVTIEELNDYQDLQDDLIKLKQIKFLK